MSEAPQRGRLRVYLGAAPGVGKTHAMLEEGIRRAGRGTRVVVAAAQTRGRPQLEALLASLAQVEPRRTGSGTAVDVAGVLERSPQVVLVDDLGTVNPNGSARRHRWEDVEVLLDRGVDVVTTVDIAQLESLSDVVRTITGTAPAATVPDRVVREADQVELVDMAPEALRRRLAHGNIYPPDEVDAAISQYYRVGNLAALRELALLWVADRVDEQLDSYRHEHGIGDLWATRERVVVALTGGAESSALLRRAARIAARGVGGELHAVHVSSRGRGATPAGELAKLRSLTEELGGSYHLVIADDAAAAVLDLARGINATQVVVGESSRSRWERLLVRGVSERVIQRAGDLDVLVVTHHASHPLLPPAAGSPLGRARLAAGWALALLGPAVLTAMMQPLRSTEAPALESLLFLALTVVTALVGGWWPAAVCALLGTLLLNWFFTDPVRTLTVAAPVNVGVLLLFLVVAGAVARVVSLAASRSRRAEQLGREAEVLAMLNRTLLAGQHTVRGLLRQVLETFGGTSAALVRRAGREHSVIEVVGDTTGAPADVEIPVSRDLVLTLHGTHPAPHEQRVLGAFATHLAAAADKADLQRRAHQAEDLEAGNRVRTALLSAVSHDLRTPLAGVKAAVSSLRSNDVAWSDAEREELLGSIEESTDRLTTIVANLLDLSRIQADAVRPVTTEVDLADVTHRAITGLSGAERVRVQQDPGAPAAVADPGLLERIVANLVANALAQAPDGVDAKVSAAGETVQLRVVDTGPGVPEADKERIFTAFQRLGDENRDRAEGLGLGLAVARGLVEAMGGSLTAEDTPGGGLTMVVELPHSDRASEQQPLGPSATSDRT